MTTMIPVEEIPNYTRKDYVSDQVVRWCPGCGDYAILAGVQKALPEIGVRKEDVVFISGIGCSSRFPYYMNTYGIHSIHGRAPTLATGLKIANPNLSVWVITGDGDGLSIGGNHLLHTCRRNIDLNILLFNNRIYGLTKGQYSPTSKPGTKTKTSPMGSIEQAFNPIAVTLGAEATFIARTLDTTTQHLNGVLKEAAAHRGTSFVEIFQNCVIFNDKTWDYASDRQSQPDTVLFLEHGKPMVFGANHDKGIRLNGLKPEVVQLGNGITQDDLLVHDETDRNLAFVLAQMDYPEYPVPFGVIYRVEKPSFADAMRDQVATAQKNKGLGNLHDLYNSDYVWTVHATDQEPDAVVDQLHLEGALDEEYLDDMEKRATGMMPVVSMVADSLASDPIANLLSPRAIITATRHTKLSEAIAIMADKNIGALVIVDSAKRPVGIFTESDVLRKIATQVEDLDAHNVGEFMTANPDTLPAHVPIGHALHLMSIHRYRHIPIVDDKGLLVDIISFRDVVHYIETYFVV